MSDEQIPELAKTVLSALEDVSGKLRAHQAATSGAVSSAVVFPTGNSMHGGMNAGIRVAGVVTGMDAERRAQMKEPFVAKVTVEDEDGQRKSFYLTRGTAPTKCDPSTGRLASYRSPIGRLGEVAIGSKITLPAGEFRLIERLVLTPRHDGQEWDGLEDRLEFEKKRLSIASLRAYLRSVTADVAIDVFAQLEASASADEAVRDGFRRGVVSAMSLRDQAVLDEYQGEIFRRDLDTRLFISGPPGSGKTTTLIKRLAQKLSTEFLSEDDTARIERARYDAQFAARRWVMFTPTDLLKLYLKEAFSREGVAATDADVMTWEAKRLHLGRDVLRILRSANSGRFVLSEEQLVSDSSSAKQRTLFDEFSQFLERETATRFKGLAETLAEHAEPSDLTAIRPLLDRVSEESTFDSLMSVIDLMADLARHSEGVRVDTDKQLKDVINNAVDPAFVKEVTARVDELLPVLNAEDDDDDDTDFEDAAPAQSVGARVKEGILGGVKSAALAREKGRKLSRSNRYFKIVEALGDRLPMESVIQLGRRLRFRKSLNAFATLHRQLLAEIPKAWRRFRKEMAAGGRFFSRAAEDAGDRITRSELDVLILATLRLARRILSRNRGRLLLNDTRYAVLESIKGELVTQILVDEVTDFSAVQVACMAELAHPVFNSVFCSGDIKQRVTREGMNSFAEFQWIAGDFERKPVSIGYRQSGPLRRLGNGLAKLIDGEASELTAPNGFEDVNIPPLLLERAPLEQIASWLSDRIGEIEKNLRQCPSVAIFVDGDDQIDPLVALLRAKLMERNLSVVGCKEGKVVGTDQEIRVFDVRHVKGLEFEAVFFVSIDRLAAREPELFDKFLYVGATRAATYLGITCEEQLPSRFESLRSHFGVAWEPHRAN